MDDRLTLRPITVGKKAVSYVIGYWGTSLTNLNAGGSKRQINQYIHPRDAFAHMHTSHYIIIIREMQEATSWFQLYWLGNHTPLSFMQLCNENKKEKEKKKRQGFMASIGKRDSASVLLQCDMEDRRWRKRRRRRRLGGGGGASAAFAFWSQKGFCGVHDKRFLSSSVPFPRRGLNSQPFDKRLSFQSIYNYQPFNCPF